MCSLIEEDKNAPACNRAGSLRIKRSLCEVEHRNQTVTSAVCTCLLSFVFQLHHSLPPSLPHLAWNPTLKSSSPENVTMATRQAQFMRAALKARDLCGSFAPLFYQFWHKQSSGGSIPSASERWSRSKRNPQQEKVEQGEGERTERTALCSLWIYGQTASRKVSYPPKHDPNQWILTAWRQYLYLRLNVLVFPVNKVFSEVINSLQLCNCASQMFNQASCNQRSYMWRR